MTTLRCIALAFYTTTELKLIIFESASLSLPIKLLKPPQSSLNLTARIIDCHQYFMY